MSSIQCYSINPRDTLRLGALDELFIESIGQSLSDTVFIYPCSIYVIAEGEKCIATATISQNLSLLPWEYQEKGIYLLNVCTHPRYQRRGYMTFLLRSIIERHSQSSIYLFVEPTNEGAKSLYHKLKFRYLRAMPNGHELLLREVQHRKEHEEKKEKEKIKTKGKE